MAGVYVYVPPCSDIGRSDHGERLPTAVDGSGGGAAGKAEQVALPGDASAERQNAPQSAAVEQTGHDGNEDGGETTLPVAAQEEVPQVAEDQAAGADVHRVGTAEEPHAEAAQQ